MAWYHVESIIDPHPCDVVKSHWVEADAGRRTVLSLSLPLSRNATQLCFVFVVMLFRCFILYYVKRVPRLGWHNTITVRTLHFSNASLATGHASLCNLQSAICFINNITINIQVVRFIYKLHFNNSISGGKISPSTKNKVHRGVHWRVHTSFDGEMSLLK